MPAALNHTIVHADEIFGRIVDRGIEYFADPAAKRKGAINHNDGGRGVYFCDPSGHYLEST